LPRSQSLDALLPELEAKKAAIEKAIEAIKDARELLEEE
jgi:hypothetical protein